MILQRYLISGHGRHTITAGCCDYLLQALQSGTDGEGYGALMYVEDMAGTVRFSSTLTGPDFCPWCGSSTPIVNIK